MSLQKECPEGWWYKSNRDGGWVGPFNSQEKAIEMAEVLEPQYAKTVRICLFEEYTDFVHTLSFSNEN